MNNLYLDNVLNFGDNHFRIIITDINIVNKIFEENKDSIKEYYLEYDHRNSKVPLLDITNLNCRIEPGAIIRDKVEIKDNAIIMMGAIINIGASIGENTMIDMNCVIGANAVIGKNCHIGAGTVIAGVIEPPSIKPVIIKDNVLIGANSVILEGILIEEGAIIGAGSIVTKDVLKNQVVYGNPAKFIKMKDDKISTKSLLIKDLR